MRKLSLNIGATVYYQNKEYLIYKQIDLKTILAINKETNNKETIEIKYLQSEPTELPKEHKYYEDIPEKDWEVAKKRLRTLQQIQNKEKSKQEAADENNCHITTIYRWLKEYSQNPILSSLLPKHSEKGAKGSIRIKEEVELIIQKSITDLYLSPQKYSVRKVYFDIRRRCKNADIIPPSENTVRSRVKKLSEKKKIKYRESPILADRLYRNTDGQFPEGKYPLDFIQIDHTPIDIIIVDEKYRQPIGRPYLTVAIDVYSRMITGFFISLDEPSYFSVQQCITHSILPKEKYLRKIGVEGEWNIFGIPHTYGLDNAKEFRSVNMQRVCEELGILISWRPVKKPQFGAHIERLIGTSMGQVHALPGTTHSNITKRGEYNSEKRSIFTLNELEKWYAEYIINGYHKNIHSGIMMLPEKKYEQGIFGDDENPGRGLPEKIVDETTFKISLLPSEERTIQQPGVKIDKVQYYSDVLRRWIKAKNPDGSARKFIFKRDPRDISTIWFYDPEIKQYFSIPYRNITYPPMSLWELRHVRQYLEDRNVIDYDETIIFKTYEKLQKIQDEAAKKTKSARRRQAAKKARKDKQDFDNLKPNIQDKPIQKNKPDDSSNFDDMFKDIQAFDEIDI